MFTSRELCGGPPGLHARFINLVQSFQEYLPLIEDPIPSRIEVLMDREFSRLKSRQPSVDDESVVYKRRHDFEPVFWIMAWFCARTWPDGYRHCATGEDTYHEFVKVMLDHRIRDPTVAADVIRGSWMVTEPERWENLLHPSIKHLGISLSLIANYLSIKWQMWEDEMEENHAFQFIRAVLKREIDRIRSGEHANIKFTTRRRPAGYPLEMPLQERTTTISAYSLSSVTDEALTGPGGTKREGGSIANTRTKRRRLSKPKMDLQSDDADNETDIDDEPEEVAPAGSLRQQASILYQTHKPRSLSLITEELVDGITKGNHGRTLDEWAEMSREMRMAWLEDREWRTWGDIKEDDEEDGEGQDEK